jgi:hypothetical protein
MKQLILIPAFFLLFGGAMQAQVVVSRKAHITKREISSTHLQKGGGMDHKQVGKPTLNKKTAILPRTDLKARRNSDKKIK